MAWLTSLPSPIYMGSDRYFETRTNPSNPDKNQVRDRSLFTSEYRGVTQNVAVTAIQGYPIQYSNGKVMRSTRPIGGGGWIVTETVDVVKSNWEDELDYTFPT